MNKLNNILETGIEFIKGVGPAKAELLKSELSIFTYSDLLQHYPFRYVDKTKFYKVKEITDELPYVQLKGIITHLEKKGEGRSRRLIAQFKDESGNLELVWFKGIQWIEKKIKLNIPYIVFGRPTKFQNSYNIAHPELELVSDAQKSFSSSLEPVYNTTEKLKAKGLDSKAISKIIKTLLEQLQGKIEETLSADILEQLKLISKEEALFNIHQPKNTELLNKAKFRLKFEELFYIQLKLIRNKTIRTQQFKGFNFSVIGSYFNTFYKENLPFELTEAQKRVLREIRKDVGSGKQMNRLLQGDVGSGKTIVALMTMLMAIDNGFQSCMMAPTEILANQHYKSITDLLKKLDVKVALLTGSTKVSERNKILESLKKGEIHILIGTHALIEDDVIFKNLGLVIIDEQHRFGVAQRAKLWTKNVTPPHVLVMTATPIPRTLAMTLYGDLDVSVINELPPGRKPVKTIHMTDAQRLRLFGFMKEQIALGRQIYVVYPLIKESEKLDYKDLEDGYESICRAFPLPEYKVSIVHGKMKNEDKEFEMQRFLKGETHIMVATTVIEVGVNVPNATVMVIESAERFGLSQLHQLRGRVGRGAEQSYCILMTGVKLSSEARLRIDTMVRTNDGFEISEVDLKLRGPGDIEGTAQSGLLDLRIADLSKDQQILQTARNIAIEILQKDPYLQQAHHQVLLSQLNYLQKKSKGWARIS
jgi:ATP-dependent DNA helicase RecG